MQPRFGETDPNGREVFTYKSRAPQPDLVQASDINATDIISVWVDLNRGGDYDSDEPVAIQAVPTAITLSTFTAQSDSSGVVTLSWRTAVEIDNAGFNLYRAGDRAGPYVRINDQLIAAVGNGRGATYSYMDATPGDGPLFYKLEDVDYNGLRTLHGPIELGVDGQNRDEPHHIYLPLIERPYQ